MPAHYNKILSGKKYNPLSKTKEKELLKTIKDNCTSEKAKDELICSNLRMAYSVAKKYGSKITGIELEDCIQEANKAVVDAVEKYDIKFLEKTRFSTFAHRIAEARVKEFIMKNSRLIRLPRHKLDIIFVLINILNKKKKHNLTSLLKEVNKEVKERGKKPIIKEELLKGLELLKSGTVSLDTTIGYPGGDNCRTIGEMLEYENSSNPEKEIGNNRKSEEIKKTIKPYLTKTEFNIISARFLSGKFRTLNEVVELDILDKKLTRQRINQIEEKALKKLKEADLEERLLHL